MLKKKGFAIEYSELETGWAIRKLTVMVLNSALCVMQLLLASDNEQNRPIEQVFEEEIKCPAQLNKKLQGGTEKSKNKNNPISLSWLQGSLQGRGDGKIIITNVLLAQ